MTERILLVEDDRRVRRATALALNDAGYEVLEAVDAEAASRLIVSDKPDVAVLDVMLPGRDGFDLCRDIRRSSELPIIFLTAKTDEVDIVVGLESSADDYLTKPFSVRELVARIRALQRRVRGEPQLERLTVGPIDIEPSAGTVRRDGSPVSLTRTEFRLLCSLASRPNQVLTREMLLELVWQYDYLGDSRLVDVHVRRLRMKIEDDASDPQLITTVRGFGYKFVAP